MTTGELRYVAWGLGRRLTRPVSFVPAGAGAVARASAEPTVRQRWSTWMAPGQFTGTGALAAGGVVTAHAGALATLAGMLLAGAVAAGVLGLCQAIVLRTALPRLRIRDWVGATVIGMAVTCTTGSLLASNAQWLGHRSSWAQAPLVASGALVVVFAVGAAQSIVLRRFTDRAALWIWANVVAWIGGPLSGILMIAPLWRPGLPAAVLASLGALGMVLTAVVMTWVTGAFLVPVLADGHVPRPCDTDPAE